MSSKPKYVTPSQLAERAGVRRQMIFNYLGSGRIVGVRTDEGWRVEEEEAERWLQARADKAQKKLDIIQRQLRGEI